jgi:hypothetical protein
MEYLAPHAAFQTHLDGDPSLRENEVGEFDSIRRSSGLDEMRICILTKNRRSKGLFPGFDMHWWLLTDSGIEPTEVEIQII